MAGALTIDTLKNSAGVFAANNAFQGIAKAWVNWNGITATVRSSLNISSITRTGVGNYTVNFLTPMADTNYSVVLGGNSKSNGNTVCVLALTPYGDSPSGYTTGSVSVSAKSTGAGGDQVDLPFCNLAVFA